MPNEMPVGRCSCGAVYACDVTGHSLGTAMLEALVFACNGDWDLAWGLLPEEDYLEGQIENYDLETHLIVHGGVYEGRRIAGSLYFIKLQKDIREVTEEGTKHQLKRATPVPRQSHTKPKIRKRIFSKEDVERLVMEYQAEPLLNMAEQDNRIIKDLQRLLYSVDRLLRLKTADLLGKVSAIISKKDPGKISRLLQGLFTSIIDTAASSWGSLGAIGEIISNSPDQFAGYVPQLYQFLKDRILLPEILRILGNISEKRPDLIRGKSFYFFPLLKDNDPEIRGYAALLIGNLKTHEATDDLKALLNDPAEIEIYQAGKLEKQTIGNLASDALRKL